MAIVVAVQWRAIACALIAGVVDHTTDPMTVIRARRALVWIGPSAVPVLARMADHDDFRLSTAATGLFELKAGPDDGALRALLDDPRGRVRTAAAVALVLPKQDPDVARVLIGSLDDEAPEVRFLAARKLAFCSAAMVERVSGDPPSVLARTARILSGRIGDRSPEFFVERGDGKLDAISRDVLARMGLHRLLGATPLSDDAKGMWAELRRSGSADFFRPHR
jgi:hypothetical protein